MLDTMVIGIAGGKSPLTEHIRNRFGEAVSILNHDSYYKDQSDLPFEVRVHMNYDHPDAFDTDLLVSHLKARKAGQSIQRPV